MQADPPPGHLSQWIGKWLEYLWNKRPRPPQPEKGIAEIVSEANKTNVAKYRKVSNLPNRKK